MKYLVVPLFLLLMFNPISSSNQSPQQTEDPKTDIESFWPYYTPYRSPALIGGIGNSSLLITTQSEITQNISTKDLASYTAFGGLKPYARLRK